MSFAMRRGTLSQSILKERESVSCAFAWQTASSNAQQWLRRLNTRSARPPRARARESWRTGSLRALEGDVYIGIQDTNAMVVTAENHSQEQRAMPERPIGSTET